MDADQKRASFELQQFLEQEKQKAMLNELVAKLTEVCWDKCVLTALYPTRFLNPHLSPAFSPLFSLFSLIPPSLSPPSLPPSSPPHCLPILPPPFPTSRT
ncbi:unnamed protein product [Closterium sp. NIES-65]|nr:unnamed protein product [Closterium sp. NIES-65]